MKGSACQVPDDWKAYVHEVDEEREGWLNSFYRSPLRIPMPAELEYWWSQGMLSYLSFPCKRNTMIQWSYGFGIF